MMTCARAGIDERPVIVVDEAYHEFAEHSVVPLLRQHENLVVLRQSVGLRLLSKLRAGVPVITHHAGQMNHTVSGRRSRPRGQRDSFRLAGRCGRSG